MKFSYRFYVSLIVACGLILTACNKSVDVAAEDFEIESVPLPGNWSEEYYRNGYLGQDVINSWRQKWPPPDSNIFTGFSFDVSKFVSVSKAKKGYIQTVRSIAETGMTDPLPGWAYKSDFADEYTMYCSWPEIPKGQCYSIARYANFVVIVGLVTDDNVTLEQTPELFSLIDKHVQTVIENAGNK